jgi:DNA-binding MarR family transcriptional regulator
LARFFSPALKLRVAPTDCICTYNASETHDDDMSARLQETIDASDLDPAACILRHVTHTSRLVVAAYDAALRPAGLTGHQFNVLMTLARSGAMNVSNLSVRVGMHSSTTPRLIAPLQRDGLVRIEQGADRRERRIAITAKGSARLVRAFPLWAQVQQKVVDDFGTTRWSGAMKVLQRLRKSLRAA